MKVPMTIDAMSVTTLEASNASKGENRPPILLGAWENNCSPEKVEVSSAQFGFVLSNAMLFAIHDHRSQSASGDLGLFSLNWLR